MKPKTVSSSILRFIRCGGLHRILADILPPSRIIVHAWMGSFHVGALGLRRMVEPAPRVCGHRSGRLVAFFYAERDLSFINQNVADPNDLPRREGQPDEAFFSVRSRSPSGVGCSLSRFSGSRSG
ncbi:hypothetical protein CEXT_515651 [Caerostris extrusa]|uniref:Uncharacterized protein n=1 Tax=Caerostris extrusa TaxID=172846 RepID=A0AAV4NZ76_CAEEX|nr:hypothetical protein CEXT_515651 [Caerostris extrusa]